MSESRRWLVGIGAVAAGYLLYLLSPVLMPFAAGALLAYMGDPLADRLEMRGLRRTAAVVLVFAGLLVALLLLVLVLVPLLEHQVATLVRFAPQALDWVQKHLLPHLGHLFGFDLTALDVEALRKVLTQNWQKAGGMLVVLLGDVSRSGFAVAGWLANVLLVPVVTFYLLRDWDAMLARLRALLPRAVEPVIVRLAAECDGVLSEFLRGQLLVMAVLGTVYTVGLWLVGLDLALLVGVVAGLVSFVPYMGVITGVTLAVVAAFFQFHAWLPLLYVGIVFAIGQVLEGMVLTPLLVGERIGLHPVAVIFAVLAGGRLFGFLGVLLALPVASVIVVLMRHLQQSYLDSDLYRS